MMRSTLPILSCAIALALSGQALAAGGASERALTLVGANPKAVHATSADRFQARDVIVDADGSEHVRMDRTYGGLPVIGGDVVVHSRGGLLTSATQTLRAPLRVALKPTLSADDAVVAAGAQFGSNFTGRPSATLSVYARGATPELVWDVRMTGFEADGVERDMSYLVSARDGRIVDRWSNIDNFIPRHPRTPPASPTPCTGTAAVGTGKTLYSGNVSLNTTSCAGYELQDMSRGKATTIDLLNATSGGASFKDADNIWGNNTKADRATAGADAHYGVAKAFDYFKLVHGRNGIAGDGKGAQARVHYGNSYVNASWSDTCFCINFGDGNATYSPLVSLDIAGHELTHGLTNKTAKLAKTGEAGGLGESTSDIFGSMVEFYAANANDPGDFTIGEKVVVAGGLGALRYMFKPSRDAASADCWTSSLYLKNSHYTSGVGNHFFYLLSQGAVSPAGYGYTPAQLVCAGPTTLVAIGRQKAEKIWYRALTVYMVSTTNYAGARVATLNAAKDLYGLNSTEYKAVAAAWTAVAVN
jgi:Zn-dependent metalloprotease